MTVENGHQVVQVVVLEGGELSLQDVLHVVRLCFTLVEFLKVVVVSARFGNTLPKRTLKLWKVI
jgi:hypothetical protein